MLCLQRRKSETTILRLPDGREIVITMLSETARLGFDAPKDVVILRGELVDGLAKDTEANPVDPDEDTGADLRW